MCGLCYELQAKIITHVVWDTITISIDILVSVSVVSASVSVSVSVSCMCDKTRADNLTIYDKGISPTINMRQEQITHQYRPSGDNLYQNETRADNLSI